MGAKTYVKNEVQGLFTTERIYQFLKIKTVVRKHKCFVNIRKTNYQNTNSIYIRLVYFQFFDNYFELHLDFVKKT